MANGSLKMFNERVLFAASEKVFMKKCNDCTIVAVRLSNTLCLFLGMI